MDTKSLVPVILFEDKDLLVINKPSGLLVHGIYDKNGPKHTEDTLVDWLAREYPETKEVGDRDEENLIRQQRGGIVHRLDRETSGVMVIARNQKSFEYFKKLFQGRTIAKQYITLVWGRIHEKSGVIDKPISIKDGTVKRTVFKGKMPREAVTEYETGEHYEYRHGKHCDELTLMKAMPKTGRTHQIRVHFSSIGHSVVGDKLYGKRGSLVFEDGSELTRQFLHAEKIEFKSPSGEKLVVTAPLPEDLSAALAKLEKVA
jgi:23S rRNA pseudouridine1911/1915/1917 synthase